ncbi:polysaccharide deacetylase family protein [Halobacterium sp. CBA1126]|uniref:polysaccharide deacetylase family protein n=1 Tax=Halobacterium sp. CBA1126 TaxID=2668074 RepID=UPI0012FB60A1|nr:polysaccharide deacetylase family protein [Halobacterium sp. CBA1126]MUV59340.1 polysaccharide deacetylase family protein [Halobacterium sp. CBA1126]
MKAYLTIDDAPSATLGAKLDTLTAHDVPAVLFCEGRRLADNRELAARAVKAGYHLGNHTHSHPRASAITEREFERELARTERHIDDVYDRANASRPARLFRFPYGDDGGDMSERFQRVLREHGFVGPERADTADTRYDWPWTFDVADWQTDDRAVLHENFEATASDAARGDEIVLFHDAGNAPELFAAFVGWLADSDLDPADPLELLP